MIDTLIANSYIHTMSPLYSESVIDQVRDASDIIDVLMEFLPLKKRGRNHICLCPFHHEKTPSFSVSQDKQIYHCFGCGKGGNVLTFLMEHEQMSFPDAVKYLAKRANIPLPEAKRDPGVADRYARLYFANEQATAFFADMLHQSEDGKRVLEYVIEKRGIDDETIAEFQIGYAPDGWDNLLTALRAKDFKEKELLDAGLVIRRESGDGVYDRFRQRLMFPIFDFSRRVIGFGARALSSQDSIKYMNSPDSPLYNKSRVLYGLSHSRAEIRSRREALIVEGYMDFLSLYQSGVRNAVAASGTSFTKDHALLLRRYADSVALLFDADAAGISAAERCAEHLFAVEIDVRVACLPAGDDPDSFIRREGSESLTELIRNAGSYFRFIKEAADPPYENMNRAGQQALLKSQLRLVGLIADEVLRALMLKEISNVYGISEEILSRSIKPEKPGRPVAAYAGRIASSKNDLEEEIVRLLLSNPHLIEQVTDEINPDDFTDNHLGDILRTAIRLIGNSPPDSYFSKLVDRIESDESRQTLTRLMNSGQEFGDPEITLAEYMIRLREVYRDVQLSEYMARLRDAQAAGDDDEIEELLSRINRLRQET